MHKVQVGEKVNEYIRSYNDDQILEKLGCLTPKEVGAKHPIDGVLYVSQIVMAA